MTDAPGTAEVDPADVVRITQLVALYGHVVDAARWDRFPELFVPDAELDYTQAGAPAVYRGLAQIQEFFRGAAHPSAHLCVNVHVHAAGDEVRVLSKFLAPYTRATHVPSRWKGGDYLDVVERTPAGWRFRSRVCVARWQVVGEPDPGGGRVTW